MDSTGSQSHGSARPQASSHSHPSAIDGERRSADPPSSSFPSDEALSASEGLARLVIDTAPNIVFLRDASSRFVMANRALGTLYGLPSDALIGKTPSEVADSLGLDVEASQAFEVRDKVVRRVGEEVEFTDRFVDAAGAEHWFHTHLVPLEAPDTAGYVLGVCNDITEYRLAELALRQSERNYRRLVDHAPVGILSVDVAGNLVESNTALLCIPALGDLASAQGDNLLLHPASVTTGVASHLGHCLDTGADIDAELRYRVGAQDVELRCRLTPLHDQEGRISGVLALVEDISERKDLERQLQQAAKMEALGRLAGGIAHDFNNQLTVINGYSDVRMAHLDPKDPVYEDLRQIRRAGQRAAELTRRLLTFSRRDDVQIRALSINEVLASMAKLLRRLLGEEIALALDLGEGLPTVRGDSGQIEQMIINLAINARDAILDTLALGSRPGARPGILDGSLRISTELVALRATDIPRYLDADPGTYVRLRVADSGSGMDDDVLEHLFEPFFTTKDVDKGTGLGLAIVYSVLQKMGGTVDVHSVPGEGATFDLYLPAAADEAADDAAWRLSTDLPQGTGRVLVVEDQDDVRDLAVHMISDLGYEVEAAANGAEAITLVQSGRRYDLVVSDVVMPGMSGPAMVTYLRRLLGDVAAVYVSGYASEAALERGGDEDLVIVHKPFTIEALATAMHQALVTDV